MVCNRSTPLTVQRLWNKAGAILEECGIGFVQASCIGTSLRVGYSYVLLKSHMPKS